MSTYPDSKKKILIISQDFIPYFQSLGGVLRVITLADYLYKNGCEVYILASGGNYFSYFGYTQLCEKIHVFYLKDAQKQRNLDSASAGSVVHKRSIVYKAITLIKRVISDFIIPDKGIRLVPKYFFKASNIITSFSIDNVLISSPPHSSQVIGWFLKLRWGNKLNLIADYRDSWNTSSIFSKKFFLNNFISCKLEKTLFKRIDRFLYVSEPMLDKIENLHKIKISGKSILVMNGFSMESAKPYSQVTNSGKIKIGYFGAVSDDPSSYRNINSLLYCMKTNKELAKRIDFYFYGPISLKNYLISDFDNIFIFPSVNHEEALMKMREMDYLMIIHSDFTNSDEVITGKFFEYISVHRPIICLTPKNMEAVRLINRYNIGIHIEINDRQEIIEKFLQLERATGNCYEHIDVNDFSRERQYSRIMKYVQ